MSSRLVRLRAVVLSAAQGDEFRRHQGVGRRHPVPAVSIGPRGAPLRGTASSGHSAGSLLLRGTHRLSGLQEFDSCLLSAPLLFLPSPSPPLLLPLPAAATAAAKSLQSCTSLCDPIDGGPPGSPPSLGFTRQEHWSGLPFPSPGHLPNLGIEPRSPALQADSLLSEPPGEAPSWWNPANLYAPPCGSPEVNPNSPRAAACTSCVCKALLESLAGFRHLR